MSNSPCRYFRFSPCVFLQIQPGYTARGDFLCHSLTGHETRSLEKGYFSSNIIHKEMIFLGVYFGPIWAALSASCRLSASVTAAVSRLGTWNKVHFGWPAFVDRLRSLQSIRYIKFGIRILAPGSAYTPLRSSRLGGPTSCVLPVSTAIRAQQNFVTAENRL